MSASAGEFDPGVKVRPANPHWPHPAFVFTLILGDTHTSTHIPRDERIHGGSSRGASRETAARRVAEPVVPARVQIYRRLPSFSDDSRKESRPARRVGNEVYNVSRFGISGCGWWICARIGAIGGFPVRCEESPRRAHVATSRAFGLASSVKCAKQREGVIVVVFRY